jgi:hypothetical protein
MALIQSSMKVSSHLLIAAPTKKANLLISLVETCQQLE